MTVPVVGRGAA